MIHRRERGRIVGGRALARLRHPLLKGGFMSTRPSWVPLPPSVTYHPSANAHQIPANLFPLKIIITVNVDPGRVFPLSGP